MSGRGARSERRVAELELEVADLRKRMNFVMNTLSITRKDEVGAVQSRSFDALFSQTGQHDTARTVVAEAPRVVATGSPPATGGATGTSTAAG
jgi:hypothetical protein